MPRIGEFIAIGTQLWLVSYIVHDSDRGKRLVVFRNGVRRTVDARRFRYTGVKVLVEPTE